MAIHILDIPDQLMPDNCLSYLTLGYGAGAGKYR